MKSASETLNLGILAIAINVSLMIIKIGAGVHGNSYALIADGIESASDIFTSIVTWVGFRLSLKPADEDHPYGHGKIDALTGMGHKLEVRDAYSAHMGRGNGVMHDSAKGVNFGASDPRADGAAVPEWPEKLQ